jgi:uncharacterized protein (DUF302 family)
MAGNVQNKIGISVQMRGDYDYIEHRVIEALKTEGFGVLTEINVKDTMKKKLGVDYLPYKILGACNPPLAHRAMTAATEIGLLLPCNVTVRQMESGEVEVSLVDPMMMMGVISNPELENVAAEARSRLERVAAVLNSEREASS